jgi:hypothetical protein
MIEGLFVLFGPLIPFVATEGVAHEYRHRTHELVMATQIPGVAYVCGRYLAVLMVSLLLDLVLLASVLLMGPLLHATDPKYVMPDILLAAGVWSVAIVPGTIVLTTLSFCLGTLLPRAAGYVKVIPVVGWIGLVFLSDVIDHGGTWFTSFNPTSYGIVRTQVDEFPSAYQAGVIGVTDSAGRFDVALRLQQIAPDLHQFIAPHIALVGGSLLLVAWTATRFRRFRDELG